VQALTICDKYVKQLCRDGMLVAEKVNGVWDIDPQSVAQYAIGRSNGRTRPRKPNTARKAQQLAELLAQMAELAAQAETLAADMMPAQAEYAGRLLWDRMDDNHRALHIAFVDTQVKLRKRAAG
jgi:hypothetical protein